MQTHHRHLPLLLALALVAGPMLGVCGLSTPQAEARRGGGHGGEHHKEPHFGGEHHKKPHFGGDGPRFDDRDHHHDGPRFDDGDHHKKSPFGDDGWPTSARSGIRPDGFTPGPGPIKPPHGDQPSFGPGPIKPPHGDQPPFGPGPIKPPHGDQPPFGPGPIKPPHGDQPPFGPGPHPGPGPEPGPGPQPGPGPHPGPGPGPQPGPGPWGPPPGPGSWGPPPPHGAWGAGPWLWALPAEAVALTVAGITYYNYNNLCYVERYQGDQLVYIPLAGPCPPPGE